jgi:sporulation protein YlmC with PRC-barrel domain
MSRIVVFAATVGSISALALGGAIAQQPPPQQQSPAAVTGGHGADQQAGIAIASDSLIGTTVKDQQGNDIGEVRKLMIDPTGGTVTSVIITRGGTFGMGAKEMSLPWDALRLQRGEGHRLVVTLQREMLEQAPQGQPRQGDRPAASPPSDDRKQ